MADEHLENINVINADQIPLTAIGRSSGLGREGEMDREMEREVV